MTAAANSLPFPHQRQLREVSLNHRRDSTAREFAEKRASVVVMAEARPTAGCRERTISPSEAEDFEMSKNYKLKNQFCSNQNGLCTIVNFLEKYLPKYV